jgi:hypothetical protein
MAKHGGYRRPAHPAAVSGPGALSARTDGNPQPVRDISGAGYGERQAFHDLQQSAPLPTSRPVARGGSAPAGNPFAGLTGFGEPSQQPGTPVTDGADAGAGFGSDALGLTTNDVSADAQHLAPYLPMLMKAAQRDDASPSLKKYVRLLFAQQS